MENEEFEPITIEVNINTKEELIGFYEALGKLPCSWPTDAVYTKLTKDYPFLDGEFQ